MATLVILGAIEGFAAATASLVTVLLWLIVPVPVLPKGPATATVG